MDRAEQAALFPLMLDELVPPEALVRVIDAWAGSLDLPKLKGRAWMCRAIAG